MNITAIPKTTLNHTLKEITEVLDLTQYQYEEAEKHYQAVGKFLGNCPTISQYDPQIFPQGSFRLGTVVRPLIDGEEYDIDLVCLLNASYNDFSPYLLKQTIGNRLKEPQYRKQLDDEHRRCWRLNYNEDSKFHLDIIPAIPDPNSSQYLRGLQMPSTYVDTAISITDNQDAHYYSYTYEWPKSNPKGYAEWFKDQMKVTLNEGLRMYAGLKGVSIDDVPFYRVKTPLQRAIQILKRHRDMIFKHDDEDRPISIIITTLSAKAYANQNNIYDALMAILRDMHLYITTDAYGNSEIKNPVDARENFADKWKEYPKRKENFFLWLERARMDFEILLDIPNPKELEKVLTESLGANVVSKVLTENRSLPLITNTSITLRNPNAIDYSPNEEFIEEKYPVNLLYNLKIDCKVSQKGFRDFLLREVYILKRNHSLKFFVARNTVPKPYEVKWKVRNCGIKANQNGVRGQILNDDGSETRTETSSFYGRHYVECYIIKNGVCVARDKVNVPIAGLLN